MTVNLSLGATRQVLVKRKGGASAIMEVDLSALGKYLPLFQSSARIVKEAKHLLHNNPANWVAEFINTQQRGQV